MPLFSTDTITYVQWNPDSDDLEPLHLHHKSLTIPSPVVINGTMVNDFDALVEYIAYVAFKLEM